jgi:prevent-host-death family protein
MKHKYISVSHAKARLSELTREVHEEGSAYLLTKDGLPVSVLVPVEEYSALIETDEILSNTKLMDDLKSALDDEKCKRLWLRDKRGKWVKAKRSKTAALGRSSRRPGLERELRLSGMCLE